MSALLDLAERCEAATGPDEQLERSIARELYGAFYEGIPMNIPTQPGYVFPRYTASLDAAMTLVPEGWRFYVDNGTLDGANSHACVFQPGDGWNLSILQGGCRDAATPALALCAAALRARAAEQSALNREGGK